MDSFSGNELWFSSYFPAGGDDELGPNMQRRESELSLQQLVWYLENKEVVNVPMDLDAFPENLAFAAVDNATSRAFLGIPQDSGVGGSQGLPQHSAVGVEQASFAVGGSPGLPQDSAVGIEQASFAVGGSQASFAVGVERASLVTLQDPAVESHAAGAVDYAAVEFACEGENGAMENMDSDDAKRERRKLSNRESARRSRRKWKDQFTQLHSQADQLRLDNTVISGLATAIIQKSDKSAVENTVLTADVRALKAELKMAEAEVIGVTGLIPVFDPLPGISTMNVPSVDASPSPESMDAAVPMQDDGLDHPFY
ncbi:light-inducible protein CPRF2-like [Hibiscus syriacus]|uniref:light-inducible protein CPRF2-like n=1 Tax=Hibiscus syriacus TaxID=106335 RepID=UPI001924AF3C|nr:light-inducible protein CPRF2-like [Hibiscus syriacus]